MSSDDDQTTCISVDELAAWVDGTVTPPERARIVVHVDRCQRCALLLRTVQETRRLVPPRQ